MGSYCSWEECQVSENARYIVVNVFEDGNETHPEK